MRPPTGAARPMMPARPSSGPRSPALAARNMRLLSMLTAALATPHGVALSHSEPSRLAARLNGFRAAHRRKYGPGPLDNLAVELVRLADGSTEVWIANKGILVPEQPRAAQPEEVETL
jgi:hypothetical protein